MTGMRNGYEVIRNHIGITMAPKVYDRVLIWLHGLGSSAEEFEDFFFDFKLVDEKMKLILMQAPKAPVSLNNGYVMNSWFDIPRDSSEGVKYNFEDIKKNSSWVGQVIESEYQLL